MAKMVEKGDPTRGSDLETCLGTEWPSGFPVDSHLSIVFLVVEPSKIIVLI